MTDHRIRAGILLFWALYFSIVWLSNTAEALKTLSFLPTDWPFVSGNYGLLQKVVSIYPSPTWLPGILFAGVIVWEAVGAVLFWQAFRRVVGRNWDAQTAISRAFGVTLGLWAAFILSDELFLVYLLGDIGTVHYNLLIAELASFILIRRLG